MLNHVRTLLMNVDGSAWYPGVYAEEIVDPDFLALDLPTSLDTVRATLFGTTPDRHMLNYRCKQLLAVAHATPLAEYLTAFDKRITYNFADNSLTSPAPWIPKVSVVAGVGELTLTGTPTPPDATGRLYHGYVIEVSASGTGTIERVTAPISKVSFSFTVADRTPLPLSGMLFRLSSTQSYQAYRVDIFSRPLSDLSALCDAIAGIGEPTLIDLFGLSRDEPHATFRRIWERSTELPLRVGALVCAYAYRAEGVRTAA